MASTISGTLFSCCTYSHFLRGLVLHVHLLHKVFSCCFFVFVFWCASPCKLWFYSNDSKETASMEYKFFCFFSGAAVCLPISLKGATIKKLHALTHYQTCVISQRCLHNFFYHIFIVAAETKCAHEEPIPQYFLHY